MINQSINQSWLCTPTLYVWKDGRVYTLFCRVHASSLVPIGGGVTISSVTAGIGKLLAMVEAFGTK